MPVSPPEQSVEVLKASGPPNPSRYLRGAGFDSTHSLATFTTARPPGPSPRAIRLRRITWL